MINYILQFLLGGSLFTLMYYFANIKKESISSILITVPLKFFISFIYIYLANGSNEKFVYNAVFTKIIYLTFLVLLYFMIQYYDQRYALTFCLIYWFIAITLLYNYILIDTE